MLGVEITEPQSAYAAREMPSSSVAGDNSTGGGHLRRLKSSDSLSRGRLVRRDSSEHPAEGRLRRLDSSDHPADHDQITVGHKRYNKLAPEVQEIIVAGKLGMPCKAITSSIHREPSCTNLAGLEDEAHFQSPLEFEIDTMAVEMEQFDSISTFDFPNARLARSMRRCQKKLLPLFDTWVPVDVMFTKNEIVYVSVTDQDCSENDLKLKENGRLALAATHGGKGLRLCDVTAGRRVIGQLSLKDIVQVHVEREHKHQGTVARSAEEAMAELNHGRVEFWQEKVEGDREESAIDIQKRWDSVNQDCLKIETLHGTLMLRFYSDLEDCEAHPERVIEEQKEDSALYKNIALQWAQTVVHKCSNDQLKQPLPHFGTNDSDELRDLLQVVTHEDRRGHRRFQSGSMRGLHRRPRSGSRSRRRLGSDLPPLADINSDPGGVDVDHPLKKSITASPAMARIPRPKKLLRFASDADGEASNSAPPDEENRAFSIG